MVSIEISKLIAVSVLWEILVQFLPLSDHSARGYTDGRGRKTAEAVSLQLNILVGQKNGSTQELGRLSLFSPFLNWQGQS